MQGAVIVTICDVGRGKKKYLFGFDLFSLVVLLVFSVSSHSAYRISKYFKWEVLCVVFYSGGLEYKVHCFVP